MAYDSSPVFRSPSYWIALAAGVAGVVGAAMQEGRKGSMDKRLSADDPPVALLSVNKRGQYYYPSFRHRSGAESFGSPHTKASSARAKALRWIRSFEAEGSAAVSAKRLSELESTKHRLRSMAFDQGDSPRGERVGKTLRAVRDRITEIEAPARAQANRRSSERMKAEFAYLKVALSGKLLRGDEKAVHEQAFRLAGGHEEGFRLLALWEQVGQAWSDSGEQEKPTGKRRAKRFALRARAEGYSAPAVAAFLGIQGKRKGGLNTRGASIPAKGKGFDTLSTTELRRLANEGSRRAQDLLEEREMGYATFMQKQQRSNREGSRARRSTVPVPDDAVFWATSKGGKDQIVVFPVAGHPGVYDLAGYTSGSKTLSGWMDLDGIEQTVKLTIRSDRDGGIVYLKKIDRLAIFDDLMEQTLRKAQ